jgi:hypothetical protein
MHPVIEVGQEPPPLVPGNSGRPPQAASNSPRVRSKGKTAARFHTINGFVDFSMAELTRAELAVWLILWRDTRHGTARTAQTDLARRAGVDVRTVRRAIGRLRERGLLRIAHQGGFHQGVSIYRVEPFSTTHGGHGRPVAGGH